ncbi:MAG: hypothetical protein ACXW0Q_00320 [Methylovulum sp.]
MSDLDQSIGNNNRYTMWCDPLQQRRFYGGCLYLVNAYEAGRITADDRYCDCAQAMSKGNCNAIRMRQDEIAAGKSLYFQEAQIRPERLSSGNVENNESYQRGWDQVGRALGEDIPINVVRRPTVNKAMPKGEIKIGSMDVAALISREVQKEALKSVTDDLTTDLSKQSSTTELVQLKREIVTVAKTDPKRARQLLVRVKTLEQSAAGDCCSQSTG